MLGILFMAIKLRLINRGIIDFLIYFKINIINSIKNTNIFYYLIII